MTVRSKKPRSGSDAVLPTGACIHTPACPPCDAPDREAAHTVSSHPEQGWSLLCNGVVLFEDTGELLPDGKVIAPHRPTDVHPEIFGILAQA
ncbi:MAG: DUF5999 family protein [Nocardioidaceae bacterium]